MIHADEGGGMTGRIYKGQIQTKGKQGRSGEVKTGGTNEKISQEAWKSENYNDRERLYRREVKRVKVSAELGLPLGNVCNSFAETGILHVVLPQKSFET